MIVGEGTPLFTIADTVGFGLKTDLQMPMIVEADKKIYLSSDGNGLTSNEIETQFGTYANKDGYTHNIEPICGKTYIIMGLGQYQIPDGVDCIPPLTYVNKDANYSNNITLFR